MVMKKDRIARLFADLKALRPARRRETLAALAEWFRVELTYSSNAIEGNTLTRAETAIVLEKGITVAGKPLKDHQEAASHAAAYDWVKARVSEKARPVDEATVLHIHKLILTGIDDRNAGIYRRVPVRIAGSRAVMPNPAKVPDLMDGFFRWLSSKPKLHPAELAAEAHYRLVTIHPFSDGNGRTARLLMNLILMQAGYPPAIIRPQERAAYINALEQAQTGGTIDDFEDVIAGAIERSLEIVLKTARGEDQSASVKPMRNRLLRIGALAKRTGEPAPTLRFWIREGLLDVVQRTQGGYQLFDEKMVARVRLIRQLQDRRLTVAEIRKKLEKEK